MQQSSAFSRHATCYSADVIDVNARLFTIQTYFCTASHTADMLRSVGLIANLIKIYSLLSKVKDVDGDNISSKLKHSFYALNPKNTEEAWS
jgi:hypothetical protein